jgi:uncharacterized membrane protein YphA (DoxX/SURF4 family)
MNVTVGGLMMVLGIAVTVITAVGTIFVAFATGMSDSPSDRMSWKFPIIGVALGVGLILLGKFSGL